MSCYFLVDVYTEDNKDPGGYEEYIRLVKPIVEDYGGEYLVRSNKVRSLSEAR